MSRLTGNLGSGGVMDSRRFLVLPVSVGLLAACGGSPSSIATPSASTTPATTAPVEPFVSAHYGYTVTSTDWTDTDATRAWDGAGAPGDGSPTVDTLEGPDGVRAWAVAVPTQATLQEYLDEFRRANSKIHRCPLKPEKTEPTTIGGEPAILEEIHCPAQAGVFAISATVIHNGTASTFFTYTVVPGSEAETFTRNWFEGLLPLISFEV
jgi:hypothetical protein